MCRCLLEIKDYDRFSMKGKVKIFEEERVVDEGKEGGHVSSCHEGKVICYSFYCGRYNAYDEGTKEEADVLC